MSDTRYRAITWWGLLIVLGAFWGRILWVLVGQ